MGLLVRGGQRQEPDQRERGADSMNPSYKWTLYLQAQSFSYLGLGPYSETLQVTSF
jgi:hypothetical protein